MSFRCGRVAKAEVHLDSSSSLTQEGPHSGALASVELRIPNRSDPDRFRVEAEAVLGTGDRADGLHRFPDGLPIVLSERQQIDVARGPERLIHPHSKQALRGRVADEMELRRQIEVLEAGRYEVAATIHWRFTTLDARHKLQRIYPLNSD